MGFSTCIKHHQYFDRDCIESVVCFGCYWHFNNSKVFNPQPWDVVPFLSSSISLRNVTSFHCRSLMRTLASRILCCGSNRQIHTDYRNPVEKKGWHGHSVREGKRARKSRPLPRQAFIAFLGTLHRGWSSFTMHSFTVGDYLLQTTKDRMLLIPSKRRMLQLKGESG